MALQGVLLPPTFSDPCSFKILSAICVEFVFTPYDYVVFSSVLISSTSQRFVTVSCLCRWMAGGLDKVDEYVISCKEICRVMGLIANL